MEKFSEFNKIKDNKFLETEKAEIKEIQVEEKKFFEKIKESAKDIFHFSTKENFKKAVRIVALATVLSVPIGEKVFAEREVNTKESTVVTEQIDKEIDKLEQAQGSKLFERIIEQRQFLKEKYNVEVVGDNSEYTFEELQDFDEALGKVQKFAPKQFGELKIALLKMYSGSGFFNEGMMQVFPNLVERVETLEEIKNKLDQKYKENLLEYRQKILNKEKVWEKEEDYINSEKTSRSLDFFGKLLFMEDDVESGTLIGVENNYDILLSCGKKNMEKFAKDIKEDKRKEMYTSYLASGRDFYKDFYIHELSHLITLGNHDLHHKELANKFGEINKKISTKSDKKITEKNNLERYQGFVSDYAYVANNKAKILLELNFRPEENHDIVYKLRNVEDIAETMTYMINDHHYADDDLIVQEKIKAIKEFLNKKNE